MGIWLRDYDKNSNMKKFIFLKPRRVFRLDSEIKRILSKKHSLLFITLPLIPYTAETVNLAAVDYLERYYPGHGINMILQSMENEGTKGCWILNRDDYIKKGRKVIKNKLLIEKVEKDFKRALSKFRQCVAKLEKAGISKNRLKENYLKFLELYLNVFAIAYCITGPITNGGYSDILVNSLLRKYNYSDAIKNAINILTRPGCNFVLQEEKDLKKITDLIKKRKIKSLLQLKSRAPNIYKRLETHQKKYYWIENNYKYVKYLSINYFFKKTIKISYSKSVRRNYAAKKKHSYKNVEKKDIFLLKKLGEFAKMHDQRKQANLIANYWLLEFLKKIAKETKTSFALLQFASFSEIINLLNNGKLNKKIISARKKKCFIINLKGGKEYWLTGRNYDLLKKLIFKKTKVQKKNIIKGLAANPGIASGKVHIIFDARNKEKKFKKGDILVTSMTRPEFVPLAKQAKAIITNEGGITCHAAIISRELKIPCIIGTKIATKVLKDGDLVKVDAERGIVRIVKKAK